MELEVAYELEPYTAVGSDEAQAALLCAILNSQPGRKTPVNFEDVCPRLKGAVRPSPPQQKPEEMRAAAEALAQAFR